MYPGTDKQSPSKPKHAVDCPTCGIVQDVDCPHWDYETERDFDLRSEMQEPDDFGVQDDANWDGPC
jgi:hypothetical protein